MFMKQLVFTEEASRSLVELLHGMIRETLQLRLLHRQLQIMSKKLNETVSDVKTQVGRVIRELDNLLSLAGFDNAFLGIFEYIDLAITIAEQAKFYFSITVVVGVMTIFIPGFLGPLLFITVIAILIDRSLHASFFWPDSIFRHMFRLLYIVVCCAYPVYTVWRHLKGKQYQK